ncbi:MAG: polysaccharide biosynthesis/export family protein [Bryobacteraceae bacterium]
MTYRTAVSFVILLIVNVLIPIALDADDLLDRTRSQNETYIIRPGDELELKFFYNSELNEHLLVRPDGFIALQLIGDVQASGRTPQQLRLALVGLYEKDLQRPEVAIVVRAFAEQRVFVDGEVGRPGVQTLLGSKTLLQAISDAGGAKDTGCLTDVKIIRGVNSGKPVVLTADARAFTKNGLQGEDIALQANDVVFIPKSRIANVNTWVDQYVRKNIPITLGVLNSAF